MWFDPFDLIGGTGEPKHRVGARIAYWNFLIEDAMRSFKI
jgi:hypothetical protein